MTQTFDFFFSYGSTYSYLSVMRIGNLCADAGVQVRWRPYYARAIMTEQNNRPYVGKPVKTKYMWRDVERRAAQFGIPFNGIPPYPISPSTLAHRVGLVASQEGWCPEYSTAVYRKWFIEHKEPTEQTHLTSVIAGIGHDPVAVLAKADSVPIGNLLDSETDEARRLGVFGSPTFAVGEEIFWGDDRLEIALKWWNEKK
jgi:2-hydroxychromene-2-carboxylate isomerase